MNKTDKESLTAYSRYLAMKAQQSGMSTEDKDLQNELRNTADILAEALRACPANEIAALAGHYSMLYAMAYRKLPDTAFMAGQRNRLLQAWHSGDNTIKESDVYGMLSTTMHNPADALPAQQRQALNEIRERWLGALKQYGTLPDVDTCERYKRLALIMKDNIDAYFGGDATAAKKAWFEKNRISMISTVGTAALAAYRQFICSLFPAVMGSKEMTLLDIAILKELVARPDQHSYARKAFHSALTFETEHNM